MDEAGRIAAEIDQAWQKREQVSYQNTRAVRRAKLARLAEHQNWRCCHCGKRMDGVQPQDNAPTFEYVIPLSEGGTDDPGNLVVACLGCNSERGSTFRFRQLQAAQ